MSFEYDALGRRTARITPSGARSTWMYDAAGRRTSVVTPGGRSIQFTYDEVGRELARHISGNLTLSKTYDPMGRLTSQTLTGPVGARPRRRTYGYRADGNVIAIGDPLAGDRRFELDAVGRVTAVHAEDWTERYAYDDAGNQTAAEWPTNHPGREALGAREYEGSRITRAGRVRYEHDALGRITLRRKPRLSRKPDTWRYEWDAEDRLTALVTPDGTLWRYEYDALGRRTAKLRLGGDGQEVVERIDFTWDGTTLCEQTTVAPGLPNPVSLTWDHQDSHPVAQTERVMATDAPQEEINSRFFAIITDLVGTPTELVDEHGKAGWQARSTVWGTTAWTADSSTYTPLRFPGQYFDPETGLHYNYFRHYDPETARYLTSDPLGIEPSPNPDAYVTNPYRWTDPLGLSPYVAVDTNPVIDALDGTKTAEVDAALAGRSPVLSPQAHRELLEGGHDPEVISKWLSERGGRMGPEAIEQGVKDFQARLKAMWKGKSFNPMIRDHDAMVLHSAAQEGLSIITNDKKFYQNAERLGFSTERY